MDLILFVGHSNNTMKVVWFVESSLMRELLCGVHCVLSGTVTVSAYAFGVFVPGSHSATKLVMLLSITN